MEECLKFQPKDKREFEGQITKVSSHYSEVLPYASKAWSLAGLIVSWRLLYFPHITFPQCAITSNGHPCQFLSMKFGIYFCVKYNLLNPLFLLNFLGSRKKSAQ